jgi:glycine/D-amino acid oxidase-like deaminating enzyme
VERLISCVGPELAPSEIAGALWSPHDLRVESRAAIPALAAYLEGALGVTFLRQIQVRAVEPPRIETTAGTVHADACVVCPGDDFLTLSPSASRLTASRAASSTCCAPFPSRRAGACPGR